MCEQGFRLLLEFIAFVCRGPCIFFIHMRGRKENHTVKYASAFQAFLSPSPRLSAAAVSVGGSEEDQRVVLGLGGHEPLHQQQPALAAW